QMSLDVLLSWRKPAHGSSILSISQDVRKRLKRAPACSFMAEKTRRRDQPPVVTKPINGCGIAFTSNPLTFSSLQIRASHITSRKTVASLSFLSVLNVRLIHPNSWFDP